MCFQSKDVWPQRRVNGSTLALPKTDQWVAWNRQHATTLTENWEYPNATATFQWRFPMDGQMVESKRFAELNPCSGCTDGVAMFANIHGAVNLSEGKLDYSKYDIINSCFTFFKFLSPYPATGETRKVLDVAEADINTNFHESNVIAEIKHAKEGHPITFSAVGSKTMHSLRASRFLFARKFAHDAYLEGYAEIMFN
eukprot:TRINITY_DN5835_c0_g1_i1.p1 TRINITY_DN5835_c0_g1~~TRINITY_DN5835_c0_g1_i1.p1  ORF type:complete len:197 (+),score=15.08 TRINITY_DN5835_c0_g1_i1:405-995(+)